MLQVQPISRPNLLSLVNTWILCGVLMVLASMYGFSFEHGMTNTTTGAKEQGLSAPSSQDSAILRLQNAAMYFLGVLVMFPLVKPIGAELRRNALISVLLLWMIASCIWSDDASASMTNGIRMILDVALSIFLVKRYATNDLLKILMLVGSVAAASSLFLIVALPQYGLQSRDTLYAFGAWQGIFGQKNLCGSVMTLLLLPAFFVELNGRLGRALRVLYIITLLMIIVMTRSAGSWILCICCVAFIGTLRLLLALEPKKALPVGLLLLGAVAIVVLGIASHADAFLHMIGKDSGMNGRTAIWSTLLSSALKRPVGGYGYRAFWLPTLGGESMNAMIRLGWTGMAYAENGILELWLELGAVGVLLYASLFIRGTKDALYCLRRNPLPSAMWYASILFYVAISNIWDGNLLMPSFLQCLIPFIAYVGLRENVARIREVQ